MIKQYMTCDTEWVIYALWCPCNLVYIGETKCDFRTRLNNHPYTKRKGRTDLPVSKYFLDLQHNERDIRYMLLEHIPQPRRGGDRLTILKKKELAWIF